jgi:hypothetical protein
MLRLYELTRQSEKRLGSLKSKYARSIQNSLRLASYVFKFSFAHLYIYFTMGWQNSGTNSFMGGACNTWKKTERKGVERLRPRQPTTTPKPKSPPPNLEGTPQAPQPLSLLLFILLPSGSIFPFSPAPSPFLAPSPTSNNQGKEEKRIEYDKRIKERC